MPPGAAAKGGDEAVGGGEQDCRSKQTSGEGCAHWKTTSAGEVCPLVDDADGRDASRRARARPAARTSFEAGSQAQQGGEQPSEPVASFSRARGLVPLLSFPRAASFPALEDNSACATAGAEYFARPAAASASAPPRAPPRAESPPPRRLESPRRRHRLELRLPPNLGGQASTSA